MEVAVNTIGGRLVLLRPTGPVGHWLDVRLSRFSPGAVVSVTLPDGKRLSREVQAGSSYSPPRTRGCTSGSARRESGPRHGPLSVGRRQSLGRVRADRIVDVAVPEARGAALPAAGSYTLHDCTRREPSRPLDCRDWNGGRGRAPRAAGRPPVQARDLFDVSAAMWDAWAAYDPKLADTSTEKAAQRTLRRRAMQRSAMRPTGSCSGARRTARTSNRTFARLTIDFVALLLAGLHEHGRRLAGGPRQPHRGGRDRRRPERRLDGAPHYADPRSRRRTRRSCVEPGGRRPRPDVLAAARARADLAERLGRCPREVQTFVGAQWGNVTRFALARAEACRSPRAAAPRRPVGATRTSRRRSRRSARPRTGIATGRRSPARLERARRLARAGRRRPLARDARLDLVLNGALNDAAVAAYGAKRALRGTAPDRDDPQSRVQGSERPKGRRKRRRTAARARADRVGHEGLERPGQRHAALAADVGQVAVRARAVDPRRPLDAARLRRPHRAGSRRRAPTRPRRTAC